MKLELIFQSLDIQFNRTEQLSGKLQNLPITVDALEDQENRTVIDAFIYRFSKIQDMMGQKLFPAFLEFIQEDARRMPFIDMLNLLEKMQIIPGAELWLSFRNLRNDLSHEYPDNKEEMVEGIYRAIKAYPKMEQIYSLIKEEYMKR